MYRYSVDYEKNADGDCEVLRGPDGFECWLYHPDDRTFDLHLSPLVARLELLEGQLATMTDSRDSWMRRAQRRTLQLREWSQYSIEEYMRAWAQDAVKEFMREEQP